MIAVRAVSNTPQQRCWVERERVTAQERRPEVGGMVVGGLPGGILGHQIGGGSGREGAGMAIQNVQRCTTVPPQSRPECWDVTYDFRGIQHHLQEAVAPPGASVTVNEQGEPRQWAPSGPATRIEGLLAQMPH